MCVSTNVVFINIIKFEKIKPIFMRIMNIKFDFEKILRCENFTSVNDRIPLNLLPVINFEYMKICHKIRIPETVLMTAI